VRGELNLLNMAERVLVPRRDS